MQATPFKLKCCLSLTFALHCVNVNKGNLGLLSLFSSTFCLFTCPLREVINFSITLIIFYLLFSCIKETEPIHPDADIVFLVDTSVGVSSEQFDLQKQFLRRMTRYFLISPLGPRAAFATYGSSAYTVIGFSGYSSDADFSLKINSARFLGGRRRIDKALDHAAKMFRDTGRVGLRIVILLTAGNYYTGPGASSVSSAMMPLRSLDAHLYVIGIGSQFTPLMFKQMVREPAKDIFQLPSFNELTNWQSLIARQLRSTSNACKYSFSLSNIDEMTFFGRVIL